MPEKEVVLRNFSDRLAVRLVGWFVCVTALLTVASSVLQLYVCYHDELKVTSTCLARFAARHADEVSRCVKAHDELGVLHILDELFEQRGAAYAAVIVDEKVEWIRGERAAAKPVAWSSALQTGDTEPAGNQVFEVAVDTDTLKGELFSRLGVMLVTNGIKIFLVAGLMFWLVQVLVLRHVERIACHISEEDCSKARQPLQLDRTERKRQDELDLLVAGINNLRQKSRVAHKTLARNEKQLLLFFDATEEAIVGIDAEGRVTFANDAAINLLGVDGYESTIERPLAEVMEHHCAGEGVGESSCNALITSSMESARPMRSDTGWLSFTYRPSLFVSLRSYPVFQQGEVCGALLFFTDNSEQRALRQERELLSQAVNQVPLMVFLVDREKRFLYVNPATEKLTGYSVSELEGQRIEPLLSKSPEEAEKVKTIMATLGAGKKWEGLICIRGKNDNVLTFYAVVSPLFDGENNMVTSITVAREISYEMALQNELLNSKKMEAVGRLAASFAHEFGNPLFGVRSVLKDFSERLDIPKDDKTLLLLACEECERMRTMIRDFQQLYRDSAADDSTLPIEAILRMVVAELQAEMEKNSIYCSLEVAGGMGDIGGRRKQLSLVLRNLIMNAVESMEECGGRLQISAETDANSLVITIGDGGQGIKLEHRELVFEPFFSTKPAVEGAGLGLSIAYGIVKSLGGTITFNTSEGNGTVFFIRVPLSSLAVAFDGSQH